MGKNKEKKLNSLAIFLASRTGRKFFNMLYSFGAAIVILGALAKIIHMPLGNELLVIGMVTEAFVFAISAFDNEQVNYEEGSEHSGVSFIGGGVIGGEAIHAKGGTTGAASSGGRGPTFIGGGVIGTGVVAGGTGTFNAENLSPEYIQEMNNAAKGMADFGKMMGSLNEVSETLLSSYQTISDNSKGMTDNSIGFSENIKTLNDNIMSINNVYEAQMKSINDQIHTIKYINESLERIRSLYDNTVIDSSAFRIENERMTRQIQELNKVYSRLLQAMNAGSGSGGYNPII